VKTIVRIALALVALAAGAAHAAVKPAAPAAPPPLIPRALLFGNSPRQFPLISPDGTQISWLAPDANGVMNVRVGAFGGNDTGRAVTREGHRPIQYYAWAGTGKHILYLQDGDGDENAHLFSADLASGMVRDLTPFKGVRAQNVLVNIRHPDHVLVALNQRDPRRFDMYRVDLASGAITLEAQNPGDVLTWSTDWEFAIRAATAYDPASGNTVLRIRDAVDKPWRDLVTMPFEQALFSGQSVTGSQVVCFDKDNRGLIIHSAVKTGFGRLVRVDAQTGAEAEVLAEDPRCDIGGITHPEVLLNENAHTVAAVEFDPGTPYWKYLDPGYQEALERIQKEAHGYPEPLSADLADRKWIVVVARSDAPNTYYSYDRGTKALTRLYSDQPELEKMALAAKQVVTIPARDGLPLVSYLTLPPGSTGKKLPLVLDIHGGPWWRDQNGFEPDVQMLANRGYAVLQVNYRGSVGFGTKFLNASTNQWGRGTQEDLYDAVKWAVDKGIADPQRIAAYGWSGGGYGTLLCLAQRPETFACGVDGCGPGEIATLFHSFPTYWSGVMTRWRRRVGDVEHDDALNRAISPQYHVDKIRSPLLVGQGQNDPRVTIANADAMVKALRDAGREVTYVVYPDEGHGFARPENNLDFFGRMDEFLAKHLKGRSEAWAKTDGATAELR
jgi:dipeptidyl aminopeptidase/acylaminoacyl peptidase